MSLPDFWTINSMNPVDILLVIQLIYTSYKSSSSSWGQSHFHVSKVHEENHQGSALIIPHLNPNLTWKFQQVEQLGNHSTNMFQRNVRNYIPRNNSKTSYITPKKRPKKRRHLLKTGRTGGLTRQVRGKLSNPYLNCILIGEIPVDGHHLFCCWDPRQSSNHCAPLQWSRQSP